jgi:uncharacterized protein (TIGR01777 family)
MNILITGGTGLIGSSFIRRSSDHTFAVLTRFPDKAKKQLPKEVQCIASLEQLDSLDDFDAVINLAGEPIIDKRWSDQQKSIITQSRLQITKKLVELIAGSKQPPKVFLSGSAIGVYGNRGVEVLTESSTLHETDFPSELCIQWEALAKQAEPYTRVVMMRTGIVLASHGGALAKMLLPFKCCLGGRVGDGQQYMSWIHYRDHIHAMDYLLETDSVSGVVNLVAPTPEKNQVFTQSLARALGRIAVLPVPQKLLSLLLGESSCLLLSSQRVVPQRLLDSGFEFQFPSLNVALQGLAENTSHKRMN